MKFSIISLDSIVALACAIPTTADPKGEVVETPERRGKEYRCATPYIWYDNSGQSSAWADACATVADQLDGDILLVKPGWNEVHSYKSYIYGVQRLDTGHDVHLNRKDGYWLIIESLEKYRTEDYGLGVQGEWKCWTSLGSVPIEGMERKRKHPGTRDGEHAVLPYLQHTARSNYCTKAKRALQSTDFQAVCTRLSLYPRL